MEEDKSSEEHKDCLRCHHIKCVDFYKEENEFEGGELYVLNSITEKKHVPCEIGFLLYPLCQLTRIFSELNMPSLLFFIQCIRDLKACAYLILSCHYRTAIQILRPVLESYLVGIYFDMKFLHTKSEEEKEKAVKDFEMFLEGKYKIPKDELKTLYPNDEKKWYKKKIDYKFCLDWLLSRGMITQKERSKIENIIGKLNAYLHPSFKHMEVSWKDCASCPAGVKYSEGKHSEVMELFQTIATYILKVLWMAIENFLPEKREEAESELEYIKEIKDVENDIKKKLIYSKELRMLVSEMRI